jgi:hypothetical protein
LFTLWSSTPHRSTKDLDFLSRGTPEVGRMVEVFRSVCSQPVDDDGLRFLGDSVRAAPIRENALYEGIRVEIDARLGNVRAHQRVDVGFGDTVTPRPRKEDFPTLLQMAAPRISMYPREAVVAEKLEAMVKLGLLNSRMKDFFDLHYLAKNFDFSAQGLSQSIQATFTRRHTEIPATAPVALTDAFAEDPTKRSQWAAFLRRSRAIDQSLDLGAVIRVLRHFLMPCCKSAASGTDLNGNWAAGGPWKTA